MSADNVRSRWMPDTDVARTIDRLEAQLHDAEQRACRAETACLVLAPIALPALIDQARARLTRNPPGSEGFDQASNNFACVLRLRQSIRSMSRAD